MSEKLIKFDLPKDRSSIIKVIGVGGGGSNAVNHMYQQGIKGVDFIVCNTDAQALESSPVPNKIQLGSSLTQGLGAGENPETGKNAALETIEQIKGILEKNTSMVFVTAGLGGGTGTGGAPIIANVAKELGILTIGIVTIPFSFEGPKRKLQAEEGLEEMRKNVDALLVICNDKLREMYGNLSLTNAFEQADNVLTTAAKGIAEVITVPRKVNVDFNDANTVLKNSGVAIMGTAAEEGENRSIKAVEQALASPLLNDNNIKGAKYVLLDISSGTGANEITMDEISEINDYVQEEAGSAANVIMGVGLDESLDNKVNVTVIATGFNTNTDLGFISAKQPEKIVMTLDDAEEQSIDRTPDTQGDKPPFTPDPQTQDKAETPKDPETADEPFIKTSGPSKTEPGDEKQVSIEFELPLKPKKEPIQQPPVENSGETGQNPAITESHKSHDLSHTASRESQEQSRDAEEDMSHLTGDHQLGWQKSKERVMRLKELSYKLKTPSGISDLENTPAYKRRNVKLDPTPHSSESQISRYTLSDSDDEDGKTEIKPNNPWIHDNVD